MFLKSPILFWLLICFCGAFEVLAKDQTQRVSLLAEFEQLSSSQSSRLSVSYESDNGQSATGIGLTLHFDSSQIHVDRIINIFNQSKVGIQMLADEDDIDQNPITDTYITAAWAAIDGGWPDTVIQPIKLFDLNIRATPAFEFSDLVVRITSSDVNFNGVGDSITLSNGKIHNEPSRKLLSRGFDQE